MINFNKYRNTDTIKLVGIIADVYMENDRGEIVDILISKDVDWLTGKAINIKAENFDFENFVLNSLNENFSGLKPEDIAISGSCLSFWRREDGDGNEDKNGKYCVSYHVSIQLNGQFIEEEDMEKLFPNFEY